ncbi:MAG: 50S ribosomal protein L11 methyltransferase [Rubricoccaceae bacterium]|nr:50S ribosomal protein L11 methyltransferase [Rubricoccaceae bacterium]
MATLALTFSISENAHDPLVAELNELGFHGFETVDGVLTAYVDEPVFSRETEAHLMHWIKAHGYNSDIRRSLLVDENWNAKWESTIEPLSVGPFVVAPTWADVSSFSAEKVVLRIDPKMSFGTGYHESTRIALRLIDAHISDGDRVLDAGTGTGSQAIAAVRGGGSAVIGFDIDPRAVENAAENTKLNRVESQVEIREGSLDVVSEYGFELIVANMISSILLPMVPELSDRLDANGRLILSGLLKSEEARVLECLNQNGLLRVAEADENEWWGCVCRKA